MDLSKDDIHQEFVGYANLLAQYKLKNSSMTAEINYTKNLEENTQQIIGQLGGLHNVIQLCLTNHNSTNIIHKHNLEQLKSIINIDSNININQNDINSETKSVTDMNFKVNCTDNNYEWHKSCITINVDINDNLYVKYLPPKYGEFILNRILLNKWFFGVISAIFTFIFILEIMTNTLLNGKYSAASKPLVSGSILSLLFVIYAIGANISIVYLIIQTFDFWYKMFNLIQYCFAFIYYSNHDHDVHVNSIPQWYIYLQLSLSLTTCASISIVDAMLIPQSFSIVKYFLIVMVVFCVLIEALFVYVEHRSSDVYFLPFGNWRVDETRIDIKTLLISSSINMALFIFKPVPSAIYRFFKKKIKTLKLQLATTGNININSGHISQNCDEYNYNYNYNYNTIFDSEEFYSGLIHKRPRITWKNPCHDYGNHKVASNSNDFNIPLLDTKNTSK